MGRLKNFIKCDLCDYEFFVVLEWLNSHNAILTIRDLECPKCHSKEWHFTDVAEN